MAEGRFIRGQDPRETMRIGIAKVLFNKTTKAEDKAYSYGLYYGDEEWMRIIQWLLKKKYTPFDVENVLRSKLMRWAADHSGDYRDIPDTDEPWVTLEDFIHYNKQPNNFGPKFKSAIDDFLQREIYAKPEEESYWREQLGYDQKGNLLKEDMGGVGAPMATLTNTPGMGNAIPAQQAATTGNQFQQSASKGSGDKWGGLGSKPKRKRKGKKVKLVKESIDESI
jgi:hypothetical protein